MNASPRIRSAWLHVRCTPALKSQIHANAAASKMPMTEYIETVLVATGPLAPRLELLAGGRVVVARLGAQARPWAVYVDGALVLARRKRHLRPARFSSRAEAERFGRLAASRTPTRRFA